MLLATMLLAAGMATQPLPDCDSMSPATNCIDLNGNIVAPAVAESQKENLIDAYITVGRDLWRDGRFIDPRAAPGDPDFVAQEHLNRASALVLFPIVDHFALMAEYEWTFDDDFNQVSDAIFAGVSIRLDKP